MGKTVGGKTAGFGIAAAAVAFAWAAPVAAQQARPTGEDQARLQQFCAADYMQFCGNLDPNGRQVEACFQRNMAKLSPGCQQAISGFQQRSGRPRG